MVFSRTVSVGKIARFWKVRATPHRMTPCTGLASRSCPSKLIRPAVGCTTRVQQLNRVVLPAPFGPMNPQISPSGTRALKSDRAVTPPNRTVTFSITSTGIAPVVSPASPRLLRLP